MLCDEVSDVSNIEQVTIVIRFVDASLQIREEFLEFKCTERITGECLANLILETFRNLGLNVKNLRGQGYDRAANMSSSVKGVQAILCKESQNALYVHCNSHILNLVIVKSSNLPPVRNMAGTLTEAAIFFNYSAKRQRFLERIIAHESPEQKKVKLKDLCRTRWIQRHEAYETFYELYPYIVKVLEAIVYGNTEDVGGGNWSWDSETKTKANGLLHTLCSFEFVIAMMCVLKILCIIRPLSIKLQRKTNDIVLAYSMIKDVTDSLQEVRDGADDHFNDFYQESIKLGEQFGVQPQVPRIASRQSHRSNTPYTGPEDYYRRTVFLPFLDHIIQEMSTRFGPTQEKASKLFSLVPSEAIKFDADISNLVELYEDDLPSPHLTNFEYARWQRKWKGTQQVPENLGEALQQCDADTFPNLHVLLRIACTIPVTSAENERNNSVLKGLKSYLRSTMSNERLTGLALMKIHRHKQVDITKVVETFAARQPRKMLLSTLFD